MKVRVAVFSLLWAAGVCGAAVIRVEADGGGDYPTIQGAIDAAQEGDIVVVADGIYTGAGNRDITYRGKAITVKSKNGAENCVIDCDGAGGGFWFYGGEDSSSVLDGFSIIDASWRGIYCSGTSPSIKNCVLSNCGSETSQMAAMYLDNSEAAVVNCTIKEGDGAGIYAVGGCPLIEGCTITGNSRRGVDIYEGSAVIRDCVISGNKTGGVYFQAPNLVTELVVDGCRVVSNSGFSGAGICVIGEWLTRPNIKISRCVICGNHATAHGAGLHAYRLNAEIDNCVLSCNAAVGEGGGIYVRETTLKIDNSPG